MDTKAEEAFSLARSSLLLDHFFFGRLAMFLKPVQRTDLPTLAVDGRHLFYNPAYFTNLSKRVRKSAIAHEVEHCILDHIPRQRGRNHNRWNRACDYVINPMLQEDGLPLGAGWLYDKRFLGMSADEVYMLLSDEEEQKSPDGGGDQPGTGEDGGAQCDILPPVADDGSPADQNDIDQLREEWKVHVSQAAYEAEQRGTMPAHLKRHVTELLTSVVPWRSEMQQFFTERRRDDYSWSRPNRMFVPHGVYLPALHSEGMGPLDFVIDTSGSIGGDQLNAFATECRAAVAALRPSRVRVIYADAAVNHVDEFSPDDELVFSAHGGGGTDFRPALRFAGEDPPVALAYLTDMYGTFPLTPPGYPVLWVSTTDKVGPFGRTIQIRD